MTNYVVSILLTYKETKSAKQTHHIVKGEFLKAIEKFFKKKT